MLDVGCSTFDVHKKTNRRHPMSIELKQRLKEMEQQLEQLKEYL
jgi:hypothetical protein